MSRTWVLAVGTGCIVTGAILICSLIMTFTAVSPVPTLFPMPSLTAAATVAPTNTAMPFLTPTPEVATLGVINEGVWNLRVCPSLGCSVHHQLVGGDEVIILSSSGEWVEIGGSYWIHITGITVID